MFENLFFNQNRGVKKSKYSFSSAMWKKKANYLSEAGADPRIMKSSALLKLEHGNKER